MPPTHKEFRIGKPLPYIDAPYFSKEFIDESFVQPGGWQYPDGTGLIIPNDYHGKYFNVSNGCRFTTNQPVNFINTVYIFGGSTIYCSEVPDEYTVPTQLQLLFNEHYGDRFIVQNYGTTTVTSTQELERLRLIRLKKGDVVIFYNGVNDIHQGIYYANPDETMIGRNRKVIKEMTSVSKALFSLSRRSYFVRRWLNPINQTNIPAHLKNNQELTKLLRSLYELYRTNIVNAELYVTQQKAFFFHFLQPNIFTRQQLSQYENRLLLNYELNPVGIDGAFRRGYPVLREVHNNLLQHGKLNLYDLTRIFDNRENETDEYYLDIAHVNHKANAIIAKEIFFKVYPKISQ